MCPYPFFEVTPPGAAPGPPVKTGPVFVASGGVNMKGPFADIALRMGLVVGLSVSSCHQSR